MDFSEAIEAQLDGTIIHCTRMVEFNFASGIQRWHPGHNIYENPTDLDGQGNPKKWLPTFGIGAVTGLAQSYNGTAPELKFELSGVDPAFIQKALGAVTEYYDRLCTVYWQFWNDEWSPLGKPKAISWGMMRSLISKRASTEGGVVSSIILTAETPFEGRARARNAYLTDRDQRTRHPGDLILGQIAGMEAKEITWPEPKS